MSILRNSIPKQRKGVGEHLSNQEWNDFINQLALQGNNHRDILANISDEIFKFEWVEYEQEDNDTQIIKIPDNSLGTDVLTIEEFKNYLNGKNSQYKANEWMYYIVEYKRGTRVFKLISKGVFFLDLDEISNFIMLLEKKVDKEDGKTLTSNDFTDLLKNKLDGIEDGAEKNINSNWFAQEGEKGFIKNKPTHMLASDVFPWAKKINMDPTDVPGLDANKITDGVFDPLRIPNIPMSKTTGLETELSKLEYTKVSVATFDMQMLQKLNIKPNGTDLLIINGMINPLYIDDTSYKDGHKIATSQSEMLSLQDVVVGTVVMRTDLNNELFILTALPASVLSNWQVASPNTVLSVAGRTGVVVLGVSDIDGLPQALNLKLDALTFESEVTRLEGLINNKVEKVSGKGLSTNDFTNDDKAKINTLETSKQDKLVAGDNITIDENNVISASGGSGGEGIDLDEIAYINYASEIFYKAGKQNQFKDAWEHSLTVDPSEIRSAQYPNGETEGVIIPHGVTTIDDRAFQNWESNNQPLVIPNSVVNIGSRAFQNWESNNQPLVIPNSVVNIGEWAIARWYANNQPLVIPDRITHIRNNAFQDWTSNNQPLVIPNSVTSIDGYAFYNWSSNNQPLIIPDSVINIGNGVFGNWSKVPYIVMKSATPPTLSNANAFSNQNNAPIYVPDGSVTAYKTNTKWAALVSRIFPISKKDKTIEDAPSDSKLYGRKDNTWEEIPEVSPMPNLPKPIYQAKVNVIRESGIGLLFSSISNIIATDGFQEFDYTNTTYKRIKEITFVFKEEEYVDWSNPPTEIFSEFKRVQSTTIPLLINTHPGPPGEPMVEDIDYLLFCPIIFKKLDGSDVTIRVTPYNNTPLSNANDVSFGSLQVTVTNIDAWSEELAVGSPVQRVDVIIKYEPKY